MRCKRVRHALMDAAPRLHGEWRQSRRRSHSTAPPRARAACGPPVLHLEPVEGVIERPFLDAQDVLRYLLDPPGDSEAVMGAWHERAQDEQRQRALH